MTEAQIETIVHTFCCHPTPDIPESEEVKKAKLFIKKRYRQLRRDISFTLAELQAKKEWLLSFLNAT